MSESGQVPPRSKPLMHGLRDWIQLQPLVGSFVRAIS